MLVMFQVIHITCSNLHQQMLVQIFHWCLILAWKLDFLLESDSRNVYWRGQKSFSRRHTTGKLFGWTFAYHDCHGGFMVAHTWRGDVKKNSCTSLLLWRYGKWVNDRAADLKKWQMHTHPQTYPLHNQCLRVSRILLFCGSRKHFHQACHLLGWRLPWKVTSI